jgi:flavin reductase (DIM6/NTAB) family NADH-FMN oxidoreductase RutF
MFEEDKLKPKGQGISDIMDLFTYGIYAIGSVRDGNPNFMIADWVMQVSFSPRLILVSFENDSYSKENILINNIFNINILSKNNLADARKFLQPKQSSKIKGRSDEKQDIVIDKLEGIEYSLEKSGLPVLNECVAYIECTVIDTKAAGDHTLMIGKVEKGNILNYDDPLSSIETGWHYSG